MNNLIATATLNFLFLLPFSGLTQNIKSISAYNNSEAFKQKRSQEIPGNIVEISDKWNGFSRYKLESDLKKKETKWLNIFIDQDKIYVSARLYREQGKHLSELLDYNGSFGFFRDLTISTEENGYASSAAGGLLFGAIGAAIVQGIANSSNDWNQYSLFIWFPESGNSYCLSKPVVETLLKDFPEILAEWEKNPSEENTISAIQKRHELKPLI